MDIEELRAWYNHETPEVKRLMTEAADTIESLQCELEEAWNERNLLYGLVNTLMNIPNMSDEQLAQLRANCDAARNQKI